MKKRMSVGELKEYCSKNSPSCISYYTENQSWHRVSDPCKIMISFPTILIYENPNIVYLKSGENVILFDRVKFAKVDTELTVLGTILTLYCGNKDDITPEIAYTLIVT